MRLFDVLLGRRLASGERESVRFGWPTAVPAMGLDGLGSSSYGPEAALAVMIPLGAAGLHWVGPLTAGVVALLFVLYLGYRQVVVAYPSNGGAYVVARENLGRGASLLAATALMIDYVLNVAVGISAGVGALTSSLPQLHAWTLPLCIGILAVVTLANLRGTGEAGLLFSIPTYVFIACFLGVLGLGLWRMATGGGHPVALAPPPKLGPATRGADLWLLMRTFAAGCTAMTGVEAVSNGAGSLKAPVARQAHITLSVICGVLAALLIGVALLAPAYGVGAMDQAKAGYQSVMSQLVGAIAGRGAVYGVAMASLLAVLCLSANTSFVGFPRVCMLVARDGFLPRPFAMAGRRLVFTAGVLFLSGAAGLLLLAFGGVTDRLIPLFAVGAFLTFTLSQAGMVAHWRKAEGRNGGRLAINALGAVVTGVALMVIVAAKFLEGAWLTVAVIPLTVALLVAIRGYYDRLDARLKPTGPITRADAESPVILVAVGAERTRMSDEAIAFAMTLSPDVIAVHLLSLDGPDQEEDGREVRRRWEPCLAELGARAPRFVLLPAPLRNIHEPLLKFMDRLDERTPGRAVTVLIPELVLTRWWERLLHARHADHLRRALLRDGGPRLNVITSPYRSTPTPAGAT